MTRADKDRAAALEASIASQARAKQLNALYDAAPAMLEALRLIAGTDPVDAALDPQRAVRVARAAIARATGEQP